ncbi:glutamate receptor-interacting protein 1 isoform X2 [Condylostylus longicornis]|uniref:glutamate receptor-interacting protein 1 isoform X2 n=1 Tax=Condylostylus longicornis TaxID=2530218 RepID=UPI00244DE21A|nr:glutamate receptor-interacting protein 1 isoform X2 [Condylostylus longicornis]
MKLFKSKKPTSCVSGKSGSGKNKYCIQDESSSSSNSNNNNNKNVETIPMTPILTGDRAMSPAQSEDSGLAPDRGPTSAIISLPRESAQAMDIIFADRPDLSYPPVIASVDASGPAADFLSPGDRIHQVDGMSTIGLSNSQIMNLICLGETPALVEIEYSLPEYISQNSLCVQTKLAQITVERENGCLGLTLRGGGEFPLMITHVRPHGPVFKTGRVKPGDRLLRVDNYSLINKTLSEAQQLLKCGHISGLTNLTIEYDVSVMQSVEYATGPLLIEIERPMNDKLGLVLANYSPVQEHNAAIGDIDEVSIAGIYIASILPASIADRCGALSIGDQILSIDDTILENSEYTPDDAMNLLDTNTGLGYTTMQIMPAHALTRKCFSFGNQSKYGLGNGTYSTLESRKSRQRRIQARKSSGSTLTPSVGVCRTETIQVILDCTHGSGLVLGAQSACGRSVIIAQILEDSVADRSGCIQSGDRIIAVNKMYSLEASTIRQLLGDMGPRPLGYQGTNWVELEIEFDMADSVIPSSGVFNVKLMKTGKGGLGITVNGSNHTGGGGVYVITEVKPGSPAHRTGSLRAGDILLAVDSHPLQHFNVDALLKDNSKGCTTLTIKRDSIPDFLFDAQQRSLNPIYGNFNSNPDREIYAYSAKYGEVKYTDCASSLKSLTPQPDYFRTRSNEPQYGNSGADTIDSMEGSNTVHNPVVLIRRPYGKFSAMEQPNVGRCFGGENTQSLTTEVADECYNDLSPYELDYPSDRFMTLNSNCELPPPMEEKEYDTRQIVTTVRLEPKGGPLGITLAGSEDLNKPITISGIVEGGIAHKSGELQIGDCLLAINEESVQGLPLSHATKLLQQNRDEFIDLKLIRMHHGPIDELDNLIVESEGAIGNTLTSGQELYAKVQRRTRSPSFTDAISTTSSKDSKNRVIHITLYKDKVYDDYGFSVSDGLYEKGVFVNRIRSGGPADKCGVLKPYDRILQNLFFR